MQIFKELNDKGFRVAVVQKYDPKKDDCSIALFPNQSLNQILKKKIFSHFFFFLITKLIYLITGYSHIKIGIVFVRNKL